MRRPSPWIWLLVLATVWAGWRWMAGRHHAEVSDEARRVLTSHLWIDQIPRDPQQSFHLFAPLRYRGQQIGVVQQRTAFEGCYRIFEWRFKRGDDRFHLRFPQSGESQALKWRIEPHQRDGFHYRLTLEGFGDYPRQWYTNRGWRTRDLESIDDQVGEWLPPH